MKNVIVFGGAGYIGARLCRELIDRGDVVFCVDALLYGDSGVILGSDRYTLIEDDARKVDLNYSNVDAVVNLAGFSNDPTAQACPELNWELNVTLAAKIAAAARAGGAKKIIFGSSASVYHSGEYEYDTEVGEKFPVSPEWHYSCSKRAGEMATLAFNAPGFCATVVRKGTVSGPSPRMRYDLLMNTMFKAFVTNGRVEVTGGGMLYRPLLDIEDAVSAYLSVIDAQSAQVEGDIFNVVTENDTVRNYAEALKIEMQNVGYKDLVVEDCAQSKIVRSYKVSARKLSERLGWYPRGSARKVAKSLALDFLHGKLQAFDDPTTENIKRIDAIKEILK